jgi:hypothetical protein
VDIIINNRIITKLIIVAVLFSGGLFENIPPTYKTIKNVKIPSNPIIKETTGITQGFKEK